MHKYARNRTASRDISIKYLYVYRMNDIFIEYYVRIQSKIDEQALVLIKNLLPLKQKRVYAP